MKNYPKLPKAFKRKWIAALRSGKFKQVNATLYNRSQNGYCCMGVAGKICGMSDRTLARLGYLQKSSAKYGIPEPLIDTGSTEGLPNKLSAMNDWENRSFRQIANWIEKNL